MERERERERRKVVSEGEGRRNFLPVFTAKTELKKTVVSNWAQLARARDEVKAHNFSSTSEAGETDGVREM